MEGQSRSSQKYLLLQVWCGLLTMSMVVMAAFVASIKSKPEISPVKPENVTPPVSALFSPERLAGMSPSYIELITSLNDAVWQEHVTCESCSLSFHQNSIHISNSSARSLFFIYAQVVFRKRENHGLSVKLIRNASAGKKEKVEAQLLEAAGRSVWMGRILTLTGGDSIRLNITGEYQKDETFWGAFQLH